MSAKPAAHFLENRIIQIIAALNGERSQFVVGVRKILGRYRFQRQQQIYSESR